MLEMNHDCWAVTTIKLDLIKMDDYFADSCAISPAAFLFKTILKDAKLGRQIQ